jgi:hypothetical protein
MDAPRHTVAAETRRGVGVTAAPAAQGGDDDSAAGTLRRSQHHRQPQGLQRRVFRQREHAEAGDGRQAGDEHRARVAGPSPRRETMKMP